MGEKNSRTRALSSSASSPSGPRGLPEWTRGIPEAAAEPGTPGKIQPHPHLLRLHQQSPSRTARQLQRNPPPAGRRRAGHLCAESRTTEQAGRAGQPPRGAGSDPQGAPASPGQAEQRLPRTRPEAQVPPTGPGRAGQGTADHRGNPGPPGPRSRRRGGARAPARAGRRTRACAPAAGRPGRVTSPPREPAPGPLVSSTGAVYGGAFGSARGKLPWPVNGRVVARFGSQRGDDPRAKWDGVLISASAGSTVRAVHGGRVVFADWLRGAGLLVILDHGGGYLSLYGHNQSLLKDAGDTVKAGDPIATVGTSGGQSSPAVYFAIRHQGRPADPTTWCRARG